MINKIRMYCLWADSTDMLNQIVNSMVSMGILEKCVCELHEGDIIPNDSVMYIRTSSYGNECYENVCDINKIPALDERILHAMLPYESMAIRMGIRRTNIPAFEYERERQRYMRALRFWNYILDVNNINLCFFYNVPHFQGAYIVYALAKIKNIPIKMLCSSSFVSYKAIGNSIEDIGMNIKKIFDDIKDKQEDIELIGDEIGKYFDIHTQNLEAVKKIENPGRDAFTQKKVKENIASYERRFCGTKNALRPYYLMLKRYMKKICKTDNVESDEQLQKTICRLKEERRYAKLFAKEYMMTLEQYNKKAVLADLNEKYIYFALQYVPEMTTMPLAGEFVDQYTSVQLLARCAEKHGIKVYVKEHGHLPFRDKCFYEQIEHISNVRLLKTTVGTYDIMNNSVAVATQTGTCILEGVLMGKPALVFGNGFLWKGMPGVYEIKNELDGERVLADIQMPNFKIDKLLVKKYFYAMQKGMVNYNIYNERTDIMYKNDVEKMTNLFLEIAKDVNCEKID